LLGGPSENLLELKSLLLPNFPTQDYLPLSEVANVAVHVPLPQELLATILKQPARPLCMAMNGQLVFDMMEDLSTTDIIAAQVEARTEPSTTGCVVEAGGNHPVSKEVEECGAEVNVGMEDSDEDDDEVLSPGNWKGVMVEDYGMLYRHLHAEYKDFDKLHRAN
jgi:hypothetical protein